MKSLLPMFHIFISPIAQWLFDGIKTFPEIDLVASKIKLLNPYINIYFKNLQRKFPNMY